MILYIHPVSMTPTFRCRICPATSYRKVLTQADDGSRLYRCSGCGVVFTDPAAWREGKAEEPATKPATNWMATYGPRLDVGAPQ
jgi:transposase-like protein